MILRITVALDRPDGPIEVEVSPRQGVLLPPGVVRLYPVEFRVIHRLIKSMVEFADQFPKTAK